MDHVQFWGSPELTVTLATAVVGLLTSIVAALNSWRTGRIARDNSKQVQEIKVSVDGRFSEMLALTRAASHAEGRLEGVEAQKSKE
jgi:hypothetical protein